MKKNKAMTLSLALALSLVCLSGWTHPVLDDNVDAAKAAKKAFPSVVRVEAVNGMRKVATGVVLDKKGHIVTTALISPRDEDIYVVDHNGERVKADFMGMDPMTHLAVVKAEKGDWQPVRRSESEELSPGSWIGVICMATESTPAVTQGIVSSIGPETMRLNVWLMPGSSGSPVINRDGKMVGLIRGTYSGQVSFSMGGEEISRGIYFSRAEAPSSGLAMAYPLDVINRVSSEIREKGKVERGWLGVTISDTQEGKVRVMSVDPDSPADRAGLKRGDIILEISGREITRSADLIHEIRMHRPGDKVNLKIKRNGEDLIMEAELSEYSRRRIIDEFEAKFPSLFSPKSLPELKESSPSRQYFFRGPDKSQYFFRAPDRYIGVSVQEINPELAEYFGVEEGTGLLINRITKDSPADEAGLKVGDVIIQADGSVIDDPDVLFRLIQAKEEGDALEIKIIRDEKPLTLKVKVAVNPERDFRFFSFRRGFPHFIKENFSVRID